MHVLNLLSKIGKRISRPKPVSRSETSKEPDVFREFEISKKDLLLMFKSTPLANRFIRYRADLIVSRGYHFDYPDKESEKIITRFLDNIKKNDQPFHNEFNAFLRDICIDCDWSGNGYLQLIPNTKGDKIVKIHKLHPLNTDFARNSQGNILFDSLGDPIGYTTTENATSADILDISQVAHLVFEQVGDELLGIPLLLPVFRTIERLVNIDWAMARALYKHGLPTRSISVGDRDHEPSIDEIKKVSEDVADIDAAAEYTHPYWYNVSTIDPKWPANVEKVPQYFLSKAISISGIPHHLLSGEESVGTRATAESLQQGLAILLDPLQTKLKSLVEDQIFREVLDMEDCDATVKMIWKSNVPRQTMPFADKVFSLSQVVIEGKQVISWKDARDLLQMPSDPEVQAKFPDAPARFIQEKERDEKR